MTFTFLRQLDALRIFLPRHGVLRVTYDNHLERLLAPDHFFLQDGEDKVFDASDGYFVAVVNII